MKQVFEKRKQGSVTTPLGFAASGMHCGIKQKKLRYDCSLVYSETPCVAAATFTTSRVKAWPVMQAMDAIQHKKHRVILASSGNANCVNGPKGKKAVEEIVQETAKWLEVAKDEILVAQTGLIGAPFPITRFKRAIPELVTKLSRKGGNDAAKGILTTDLVTKETAVSFMLGKKKVTIGGIAKGSGMLHPNMATMLAFITTDVAISKSLLQKALKTAVDKSFNQISVDNDMSTNDTVFVLANGEAGNAAVKGSTKGFRLFEEALTEVCKILAREMVQDGEGVSHVCTLKVCAAKSESQAKVAARQIANSMLFKTMLNGSDPNWGRIVAAVGASGVDFNFDDMKIVIGDVPILSHGNVKALNMPKARKVLQKKAYNIEVHLGKGSAQTEFITSDLTAQYVRINSDYN